jgi:hypothetical protein
MLMAGNLGGAAMVTVIGLLKDTHGSFSGGVAMAAVLALVVTAIAPESLLRGSRGGPSQLG